MWDFKATSLGKVRVHFGHFSDPSCVFSYSSDCDCDCCAELDSFSSSAESASFARSEAALIKPIPSGFGGLGSI